MRSSWKRMGGLSTGEVRKISCFDPSARYSTSARRPVVRMQHGLPIREPRKSLKKFLVLYAVRENVSKPLNCFG